MRKIIEILIVAVLFVSLPTINIWFNSSKAQTEILVKSQSKQQDIENDVAKNQKRDARLYLILICAVVSIFVLTEWAAKGSISETSVMLLIAANAVISLTWILF